MNRLIGLKLEKWLPLRVRVIPYKEIRKLKSKLFLSKSWKWLEASVHSIKNKCSIFVILCELALIGKQVSSHCASFGRNNSDSVTSWRLRTPQCNEILNIGSVFSIATFVANENTSVSTFFCESARSTENYNRIVKP